MTTTFTGSTEGVKTLRTQDTSDPRHFGTGAEVSIRHFGTSAELSGHFGTSAEMSWGHFGMYGSSPEAHLTRTREWPNPKPNPKPNPNPNPNHNPKNILVRCASGLDPEYTWALRYTGWQGGRMPSVFR